MSALSALIGNPAYLYSPPQWQVLQQSIPSRYTMEEEGQMFDKVLSEVSIKQALEEFRSEMENKNKNEDDIELF
ncbi:MAG: hypothetical protein GY694_07295 [Gammaproteobacteria bacterium]|nr:hypothetical protein [Gammaproteobacteria bacterium]